MKMNSETEYVIEISIRNMHLVVSVTVLIQKQKRRDEERTPSGIYYLHLEFLSPRGVYG